MKKFSGTSVYLFAEFSASLCLGMLFVSMSLCEATVAGLSPIQLVLVGTTLEVSAFLFEVPTGVVADEYSRRLSIIIGYLLMGAGFLVEGLFPVFLPILLGGVGVFLIGFALMVIMPETGFHPTPKEDRNNWQHMGHTFKEGIKA